MHADRWISPDELRLMRSVLRAATLNMVFAAVVLGVVLVLGLRNPQYAPAAARWYVVGSALAILAVLRGPANPVAFGIVDTRIGGRVHPFEASLMWLLRHHRSRVLVLMVGAAVGGVGFLYGTIGMSEESALPIHTTGDMITLVGLGVLFGATFCGAVVYASDFLYVRSRLTET